MLIHEEDYRYKSPDLTREKLGRLHRLATGERAPRAPRNTSTGGRHQPGIDGQADYEGFLRDRFGSDGPPTKDHPNQPDKQAKKSRNSETP